MKNNKINENNMSKIVLKEEELMTLVNESVKRIINEAIQDGKLDESFGHWLGQTYQGIQNKWNNFTDDFNAGRDKLKYDNRGYDAYSHYGNDADKIRGYVQPGERRMRSNPITQNTNPDSQNREAVSNPTYNQQGQVQQQKKPIRQQMNPANFTRSTIEQLLTSIGMKPQYDRGTSKIINWQKSNKNSAEIQSILLQQWKRYLPYITNE